MRRLTKIRNVCLLILVLLLSGISVVREAEAAGAGQAGRDILHVPMSWCVVIGSPAQANPNILGLSGTLDTNTDAVIWRRHERPTDNILLPQADISLRSAINNTWGSFNFPLIVDPDMTFGVAGDVNGWDVSVDSAEFTALLAACDTEYAMIGKAGLGITAVNINLYHDGANPLNDSDMVFDYVGVVGWGGCMKPTSNPTGPCSIPYYGVIMVDDNNYLYPTVADRTWPPSPADPVGNLAFVLTDSLDQLVAHEVGHALSLPHRLNTAALMNPMGLDNVGGDNDIDNINLNSTEIANIRAAASTVGGLEIDPPGVYDPGDFAAQREVDGGTELVLPHLNISSVQVALDLVGGDIHFNQFLKGLLPTDNSLLSYAILTDLDNRFDTGCSDLPAIGVDSAFPGADMVAVVELTDMTITNSTAYFCAPDGTMTQADVDMFDFEIQVLRLHPYLAQMNDQSPLPQDFIAEVHHTINLRFDNSSLNFPVGLGSQWLLQAVTMEDSVQQDRLDDNDQGTRYQLELPSFPHCFPQGDGVPGGMVTVDYDGLIPNTEVHALLGPNLLVTGVFSDANGEGTIQLPISAGTTEGPHLVTIGHDAMALTADCTLQVRDCPADAVVVSMPDSAAAEVGTSTSISINLSDVTGQGVFSADVSVRFDSSVLQATAVTLGAVTAGAGCQLASNLTTPGVATVAVFCTGPMAGEGALVDIDFDVVACSDSVLDITSALLNEGVPDVCIVDGFFTSCADLSGRLAYYDVNDATGMVVGNTAIVSATVGITNGVFTTTTPDCNGDYAFNGLTPTLNYTITPRKLNDFNPAGIPVVTAMDAAVNAQHVVGLVPFTSPLQFLASDVSANGASTAFDSSLILQFDVGDITKFPAASSDTDWAFVPVPRPTVNQVVQPPDPLAGTEGNISYQPLVQSATGQDFVGILYGDVTGNWTTPACAAGSAPGSSAAVTAIQSSSGRPGGGSSKVNLPHITAAPGELIQVPIRVKRVEGAIAFDFDLQFDPRVLKYRSATVGSDAPTFALAANGDHPGRIRIGMYDVQSLKGSGEIVVVTLEVIGQPGDRSELSLPMVLINEAQIEAAVEPGSVRVRPGRSGR